MLKQNFWKNKNVFITGHTGFKGTWLCLYLAALGVKITGYSLKPPTTPNLFDLCGLEEDMTSIIGDICDQAQLTAAVCKAQPEIVIHMAAQPLVRESYQNPVETYQINVMGTVNLLESVRSCPSVRVAITITTDKCYENKEWEWGYRENDPLGGYDPYSSSKACDELIVSAYKNSFFQERAISVATARAGNVIGSGDWAKERLIPDCIAALSAGQPIVLRNPGAIRPWQHVLEALTGYLILAQHLYQYPQQYDGAWNFGPGENAERTVQSIVELLCDRWGTESGSSIAIEKQEQFHEACFLKLDSSKARHNLQWRSQWSIEEAIQKTAEGYQTHLNGGNLKKICQTQIAEYINKLEEKERA